jgi:cystathionine beta-lyase/cystathionine gamma-synthase
MRIETHAVHAGRGDFHTLGVHAPPVDLSSTYPLLDLDAAAADFERMAAGGRPQANPVYARLHNPTVARWEEALASLEGAADAVAFASGMAAIHGLLLALRLRDLQEGVRRNRIVAVRPLYGGTDHLLASGLLGFTVDWAAEHEVADLVGPETALVLVETPANPTLTLVDVANLVRQAGDVPVAVDNTFATPILQNPLALGATFAIHSATKFLGGHGDVIAGAVAANDAWCARLRQVRILTGGLLHPWAAFLLHRSLPTLPLRVTRAQDTARCLAERLATHAAVRAVHYPGLAGADPHGLVGRQMRGPGAVLAFEVEDGAAANRLLEALRLATVAVSLGGAETLVQAPAAFTHRLVDERARAATGIHAGLLRISVGLEHLEDLWTDFSRALAASAPVRPHAPQLPIPPVQRSHASSAARRD